MIDYWARVDRNLGVVTKEEQLKMKNSCVAIAGCGGMGGLIACSLARTGVGKIKIADCESFDVSNLNRQWAANLGTLGSNKAAATFSEIFRIVEDVEIETFEEGVTVDNTEEFLKGANVVCDAIEFYALKPRVHLYKIARSMKLNVVNCNVVGFGSRAFLFTPNCMTIEEFLEVNEETEMTDEVIWRLVKRLAPDLPEDISDEVLRDWVFKQRKVPIFGSTPVVSAGVAAVRTCLELIGYELRPWIQPLPPMPAYFCLDIGRLKSYVHTGKWW